METKFFQHIYTSSRVARGFGTLRVSPEIRDFIHQLERNGAYKPPVSENFSSRPSEDELTQFPIQFTHYKLKDSSKSVFCRSGYRGRDNHSRSPRFGSYFSHSIVLDSFSKEKGIIPFELFFNEFWETKLDLDHDIPGHEAVRETIGSLSLSLEVNPDLYLECLNFLLAENGKRVPSFLEIIDLIIDGLFQSDKKIVIVEDDPIHLPYWMCGLCLVFPQQYFEEFSFSSYYYDPSKCHSQIVGTVVQDDVNLLNLDRDPNIQKIFWIENKPSASNRYIDSSTIVINNERTSLYKNEYTEWIAKILQCLATDTLAARKMFSDSLKYVSSKRGMRIDTNLNKSISFCNNLAILINDNKSTIKEIKIFLAKYPEQKLLVIDQIRVLRIDIYKQMLTEAIKAKQFTNVQQLVKEIEYSSIFKERYFRELLEYFLIEIRIDINEKRHLLFTYSTILLIERKERLLTEVIENLAIHNKLNDEVENLEIIDLVLVNKILGVSRISLAVEFWKDLEKIVVTAKKLPAEEFLWSLKKVIESWKSGIKELGENSTSIWLKKIKESVLSYSEVINFQEITSDLIQYFKDLFEKYKNFEDINAIKNKLNFDFNYLGLIQLSKSDWKSNIIRITSLFDSVNDKQKHAFLMELPSESKFELILSTFENKLINPNFLKDREQQYLELFFKEYIDKYNLEKFPFVELALNAFLKISNSSDRVSKARIAARMLEYKWMLNKSTAEYLSNLAIDLIDSNDAGQHNQLAKKLYEIDKHYDLNLSYPIIVYQQSIDEFAYKDKDELYNQNGILSFLELNRSKNGDVSKCIFDLLGEIVKKRFNFEDFLKIFKILETIKIDEVDYFSGFVIFCEKFNDQSKLFNNSSWLKEQLIIAVLLTSNENLCNLMFESINVLNLGNGNEQKSLEANERIIYYVENQANDSVYLEGYLKRIKYIH